MYLRRSNGKGLGMQYNHSCYRFDKLSHALSKQDMIDKRLILRPERLYSTARIVYALP
jgi:hypothetical protein